MAKNILLLYFSKDKTTAEKLASLLREAQFFVQLTPSSNGLKVMDIDAAEVFSPVLSTASLGNNTFCSNVEQLLKDNTGRLNIPFILEQGALNSAAKNEQLKKLIDFDNADVESDGISKAVTAYVRILNKYSSETSTKTDSRLETYLRRLQARIGQVHLSKGDSGQEKVHLEQVYVPLMIDWLLSVKVQNYKIVEWWIIKSSNIDPSLYYDITVKAYHVSLQEDAEMASFNTLGKHVQQSIDVGIDSKYDDPGKRPLVLAPPWYDGVKEGFWPIQAIHAAATFKRLVILGAPGSGKSTFVRYLSLCLLGSKVRPELPNATTRNLNDWPHGALIPIFVELRQFVGWDGFPSIDDPVTEDHFWAYIKRVIIGEDQGDVVSLLKQEMLDGKGIFILDGLDEVPVAEGKKALERRRQQLKDLAGELGTIYAKSRIIFTSRDYAYRDWELEGFTSVKLAPLNIDQMKRLATKLYMKKGFNSADSQSKADRLLVSLQSVPETLKDYPLFLTLMATLFIKGESEGLPTKKGDLYHQSIMLLLNRWTEPGGPHEPSLAKQLGCGVDKLYERLEVVAYKTHLESVAKSEAPSKISRALLLDELFEIGGQEDVAIAKLLSFVSEQAGVLVSPETRVFQFAHRGFQEYLAASYIYRLVQEELKKPGTEDDYKIVKELIEQQPQLWREPCLLLGEVIVEKDKRESRLWDLISALINEDQIPNQMNISSPIWWSVWLACRILLDHELYTKRNFKVRSVCENLTDWCKELLNRGEALPTFERVEVATLLGLMGDDRPGIGVKDDLPHILWSRIPSGEFTLGTTPQQIEIIQRQPWAQGWSFTRETPHSIIELPQFEISRYPITIAQFNKFVDDKEHGYFLRKWWTKAGWDWMQKEGGPVQLDQVLSPNLPCINVSWYEAIAFCNWLSEKLGSRITLPTEVQWEKAAKGTNGKIFPWGNEFVDKYCNSTLSGFGKPIPVGCYKLTSNPWGGDGPQEMSGNIWEWCTSLLELEGKMFSYPYDPDDGRENLECSVDSYRIVRGGSFLNPPFLLRSAYRGRDRAYDRAKRVGFRVVKLSS
jgi:formylglycine-generating enzyme required for sulfatase activity